MALLAAVAALTTSFLALGPVGTDPALAAPADDCAAPTRTVQGSTGGATLDVAAGEIVLLTGTQSGGLGSLPAGATLCVAAGATLRPSYVNNPAGTLYVGPGGTLVTTFITVARGFVLENEGSATFGGLSVNGAGTLHNAATGTMIITGSFTPTGGDLTNDGDLTLSAGGVIGSGVRLTNNGTLTSGSNLTADGPFENAGTAQVTGDLVVNSSGTVHNLCVLETSGAFTNLSAGSTSTGLAVVGTAFRNDGTWQQSDTAALSATSLMDDGDVAGFGRYVFTGATSVVGTFSGDSATQPIAVDVPRTSTPPFFDVQTGTVSNVVAADITLPGPDDYPAPDCAHPGATPAADLTLTKSGPVSVAAGDPITWTITVTQGGPDPATDVVVTDDLPASVTGVTLTPAGTVTGSQAVWSLGTLAPGDTVTLTVSGTAPTGADVPADGTVVNTAAVTSTTPDPDPSDDQDSATTTIAAPVPGPPPTADPLSRETTAGRSVVAVVTGSSTVPGVRLTYRPDTGPASGSLTLTPIGFFLYTPDAGFLGVDTFTFVACDNQTPEQCSAPATVTILVHPRAVNDAATTDMGEPVTIAITANDSPGAAPSTTLDVLASHGLVSVDPVAGTATYQPAPNYLGTDQFTYRTCAVNLPTDCATAIVVVQVVPDNHAPLTPELDLETVVGTAVSGPPAVSDPDSGDTVVLAATFPPSHGSVGVAGALVTYTPEPGFAGRDSLFYTACDDGVPMLCSTGQVVVLVDPVAVDDTATTTAGTAVGIDVVADDLGTVLDPVVTTAPSRGTVTQAGGTSTYTPAAGFSGVDSFTYRICATDGSPACADATVTITVTAAVLPDPVVPGPGDGGGTGGGSGTGGGGLARTGADSGGLGGVATVLLGAGALLVLARCRLRVARG